MQLQVKTLFRILLSTAQQLICYDLNYLANLISLPASASIKNISPWSADGRFFVFTTVSKLIAAGLASPVGLAFDNSGDLFVATRDPGEINRITPAGNITVFATGLFAPTGLAAGPAPVPEPSTSLLLVCGVFALLGCRTAVQPSLTAVIHNAVLEGGDPFTLTVHSLAGTQLTDGTYRFTGDYLRDTQPSGTQ